MIRPLETILRAWNSTARAVAANPTDFLGRDKETKVFRRLRREIELLAPNLVIAGPDYQTRFNNWNIDLVCSEGHDRFAIEGKYKTLRDAAVPDNRKAAFLDLYRLETYVGSGQYAGGVFLWLTDHPSYRREAVGDSADFSTHEGRSYRAGTPLRAARARNAMPMPLVLRSDFIFRWGAVDVVAGWYCLKLCVATKQPNHALHPTGAAAP